MVEGIFGGMELAFLCRVALFCLRKFLRFVRNGMESDLAIWVAESLLKNCADAMLRGIGIDDEGLSHPRMSEHRLAGERLLEGLECFFFLVGPDDGSTFLWGSFEKIGQWQSHFRIVPDVAPVLVGKVVESTYVGY